MAKKPTKKAAKPEPKRATPTKVTPEALDRVKRAVLGDGEFTVQPFEMKREIPPLGVPVFVEKAILDEAAALVGGPAEWVAPTAADLLDDVVPAIVEAAADAVEVVAPPAVDAAIEAAQPVVTEAIVEAPAPFDLDAAMRQVEEDLNADLKAGLGPSDPFEVQVCAPKPLTPWRRTDTASTSPLGSVSMVRADLWIARVGEREVGTFASREKGEAAVEKRRPW